MSKLPTDLQYHYLANRRQHSQYTTSHCHELCFTNRLDTKTFQSISTVQNLSQSLLLPVVYCCCEKSVALMPAGLAHTISTYDCHDHQTGRYTSAAQAEQPSPALPPPAEVLASRSPQLCSLFLVRSLACSMASWYASSLPYLSAGVSFESPVGCHF